MSSIHSYMHDDHRACDDAFVAAEAAVVAKNWDEARAAWQRFRTGLLGHFGMEEEVLFPQIEQASGMAGGPTEVMRMDHAQMRAMLPLFETALEAGDGDAFLGHSQTMMVLMQQHNMKEEQVLYPMADQLLPEGAAVVQAMQEHGAQSGAS